MLKKVIQANVTEHGHWLSQGAHAYEVRMTNKKSDDQWRSNHVILAIASTVEEAVSMCKEQYPDDPVIHQVALRNRDIDLILSGSIVSQRTTD